MFCGVKARGAWQGVGVAGRWAGKGGAGGGITAFPLAQALVFFPQKSHFSVSRGLGETFLEVLQSSQPAAPEQTRAQKPLHTEKTHPEGTFFPPKSLEFLAGGRKGCPRHRCAGNGAADAG